MVSELSGNPARAAAVNLHMEIITGKDSRACVEGSFAREIRLAGPATANGLSFDDGFLNKENRISNLKKHG